MSQSQQKIYVGDSRLDSDTNGLFIKDDAMVNGENFRIGDKQINQNDKKLVCIAGNKLIPNSGLPTTGTNISIGVAVDEDNNRAIIFNWNSAGAHGIYCFIYNTNTVVPVLLNANIIGGLGFDQHAVIHSTRVENGCVYWTDNLNPPRRVNINAGINMYNPGTYPGIAPYTPNLDSSVISWIRRQPMSCPIASKGADPSYVNGFIDTQSMQFAYRYQYREYEYGVMSPHSNLINYNLTGELYNYVNITLSAGEIIQQDVIAIDLIVYFIDTNSYFIIKSWSLPNDAQAFSDHNNNITPLSFNFYNDFLGIAIDPTYAVTPFDSVPLLAQTLEIAKNRSFMGNYTIGYNTPLTTSLSFGLQAGVNSGASSLTGQWHSVSFSDGGQNFSRLFVLEIATPPTGVAPFYKQPGGLVGLQSTYDFSQLTMGFSSLYALMQTEFPNPVLISDTLAGVSSTVTNTPNPGLVGVKEFKTGSSYSIGITFYDYYGRKCGVLTNNSLKVNIPDRFYGDLHSIVGIQWVLSNANALAEIPSWAYYFSVDITRCLRTRFFQQFRAHAMSYVTKNAQGVFLYTQTDWDPNNYGIAIDISNMTGYAQGYVFAAGDLVRLYNAANVYTLAVLAQDGPYIIVQNANIGYFNVSTVPAGWLFELYTPYKPASTEPFYEYGSVYPIANPTTANRAYATTSGTLVGDVYLLQRAESNTTTGGMSNYLAEAMSPNDKLYQNWNTDCGRPNFIDTIGQVIKISSVAYSDTFISGAKVNGLSTYEALNTKDISSDYGAIMKLQLTSKIQKTGAIMLAICAASETASLYLGEHTLIDTGGGSQVGISADVIGTVNQLRGERGTLNPESVVEYRGNVYWVDMQNAKVVQYSDSGLFDISSYDMERFFKLYADAYKVLTTAQFEAFGYRQFIFADIDPKNEEYVISLPQVLADPPLGYLPDYPSIPYPFDFFDGRAKTVVYKLMTDPNKWTAAQTYYAENNFHLQNNFYTFNKGNIYVHNYDSKNANFYGVQYKSRFMVVFNSEPNSPKAFNKVSVESDTVPSFAYFLIKYPYYMGTDLQQSDWTMKDGIFYSTLYRNKFDPSFTDPNQSAISGERIRGVGMNAMFEFTTFAQIKFVNAGYTKSLGNPV